jgi:type II secretory pathway pseudopilin PulG
MIRKRATTRRAFSLFELLVVVGIIIIILILTVPGFAGLVKSNNFAAAVNQLAGTLEAARERARANNRQTAVAVLFDLDQEGDHRTRLLILEEAGRGAMALRPEPGAGGQFATVFRPAANTTPILLPPGVMIFGLSRHHFLPEGGYTALLSGSATFMDRVISDGGDNPDERNTVTSGWYVGAAFPDPDESEILVNPWLAPRNDPRIYMDPVQGGRDISAPIRDVAEISIEDLWSVIRDNPETIPGFETTPEDAVRYMRHAQSFMIRFSPNGSIIATSADTTQTDQAGYAYLEFPDGPVATDPSVADMIGEPFDNPSRFDPEAAPRDRTLQQGGLPPTIAYETAGPNPEVALRAVTRLAVVDLQDLQRGTGVSKPWLLRTALTDPDHQAPWPDEYVPGDVAPIPSNDADQLNALVRDVSRWIDRNAVLLDFSRYSGRVMRR